MYRLICSCGQELKIRSSQAGCEVTCVCGKQSRVPSLSDLKAHQDRNEATPAMDLPVYLAQNKFALAMEDCQQVINIEPNNAAAHGLLGRVLQCEGQFEEAIVACTRAIELGEDYAPVFLARAISYAATDRLTLAISDCETVLANEPDSPVAIQLHGRLLLQDGDLDAAMDAFYRTRELAPDWAEPREQLSLVHLLKENQMVTDSPQESLGYRMRAFVRWEREEYVESNEDYTRVIEMDGPTSDCLSSRGQVQAELGDWDRALTDLNQAVDMSRQACQTVVLAYALNGRSLTLAGLERNDESNRDFEESTRLCPTNPWVYYHRGLRQFQRNEFADAKVLLELALELNDPPLSKRKKQRARVALDTIARKCGTV